MLIVEEQRSSEHVAIVKVVLLHIQPQMIHFFFHHGNNTRLASLPKELYRVRLTLDADAVNGQICNLLNLRSGVVHQREHLQMSASLPSRDIRLVEKQADAILREIVQRFLFSSHGLY